MTRARPFDTPETLHAVARETWRGLLPEDWLEAFACHPRIGDREAMPTKLAGAWSGDEQSGVAAAADDTIEELMAGNRAYEERFGHIFIICATGLSAEEMLAALRTRLQAEPGGEILAAAAEQEKITALRLDKLIQEVAS